MSLIIASGSNLGQSQQNLQNAQRELEKYFKLIAVSRIYTSKAVDYENQPDFFNQVLEFELPALKPLEVLEILLQIEKDMGRTRDVWRGPRTVDLDIIFWGMEKISSLNLEIPHPRWLERSFVVHPLRELPFFQTIEKCFTIPLSFTVEATPS
jgi:2-amino-4-hydroxy-6-hydroxymethyldihydropteridine diphosphokinase